MFYVKKIVWLWLLSTTGFFLMAQTDKPGEAAPEMNINGNAFDRDFAAKMAGKKDDSGNEAANPKIEVRKRGVDTASTEKMFLNKSLEVKAEPQPGSKVVIGSVKMGEEVEVLYLYENFEASSEEDFHVAKIRFGEKKNKEGFILNKYLQKDKPYINPNVKVRDIIVDPKVFFISATSLRLREEPNLDAETLNLLDRNTRVIVSRYSDHDDYIDGLSARWAFVELESDSSVQGWVFGGYLSDKEKIDYGSKGDSEDPVHIYKGTKKYVKSQMLHLRDEPGKYGTILGAIEYKTQVKILERTKTEETIMGKRSIWVKIQADELTGWVFGGFLSNSTDHYLSSDAIDKPFIYPLDPGSSFRTSNFGSRFIFGRTSFHSGIDVGAAIGIPIYAAGDGVVEVVHDAGKAGYGRLTIIKHDNGLFTYYAHQNSFETKVGARVRSGDLIGRVGTTGNSTGPHLHFEVRTELYGTFVNPDLYMVAPEK